MRGYILKAGTVVRLVNQHGEPVRLMADVKIETETRIDAEPCDHPDDPPPREMQPWRPMDWSCI